MRHLVESGICYLTGHMCVLMRRKASFRLSGASIDSVEIRCLVEDVSPARPVHLRAKDQACLFFSIAFCHEASALRIERPVTLSDGSSY